MKQLIVLALTLCLVSALPNRRLDTTFFDVIHYDINISTIDEVFNMFEATVSITVNIKKVSKIQFHKDDISLIKIKLDADECVIESEDDDDTQITTISCDNATVGEHTLSINYVIEISTEDMDGFYVSKYEENNVTKTFYATQFEPTYARRFFPCFDEPELKATFQITVNHDPKYTALSNTPVESTKLLKTTKQTKFEKTPIMSTYLIALVLAEFESSTSKNEQYAVWYRPEAKKYTTTAVNNVDKIIDKLGEFMGIKYEDLGIKKSAQIAIPNFVGATENWGLITYSESDLFDEIDKTTAERKQKIITILAHELAHQWFGNYATLEWWGEAWLNEGFATYFEYHISDLLQDDFDLDKQFLINVVQPVLITDSASSVQALVTNDDDVNTLAEINDKFGDISYDKGGSVLRMIRSVLGDDAFKTAINKYLSGHAQGFVSHDDFIKALGEEKFRNWFEQPGYPLVTVHLKNDSLYVEQSDYTTNTSQFWPIPYRIATSKNPTTPSEVNWMWTAEMHSIDVEKGTEWVIVNWEQEGYYRVNYETKLFDTILEVLYSDLTQINELNRAQLIDDTFNLAITGQTTYQQAISLISYLHNETAYAPWAATINVITALLQKINDETIVTDIQQMVLQEMESVITIPANVTDLPFESHIETIKGVIILKAACTFGHSSCVAFAKTVFDSYIKDKGIDNNYRGFGLSTALKNSDKQEEDWNKLWDAYGEAETSFEKDDILAALGCTSNKTILQDYLLKSIDKNSGITKQDFNSVYKNVLKGGPVGVQATLQFLINHFIDIYYYHKSALRNMFTRVAKLLVNEDDVEQMRNFIKTHQDEPEIKLVASQVNEILDSNVKWIKEKLPQLQAFFSKPTPPTPTVGAANAMSYTLELLIVAVLFVFGL